MSGTALLDMVLRLTASIPSVGPYLAKIVAIAALASVAATALMAVWKALINVAVAMSAVPGFGRFAGFADKMRVWDTEAQDILNKFVLPFLDRISMLSVPQKAHRLVLAGK